MRAASSLAARVRSKTIVRPRSGNSSAESLSERQCRATPTPTQRKKLPPTIESTTTSSSSSSRAVGTSTTSSGTASTSARISQSPNQVDRQIALFIAAAASLASSPLPCYAADQSPNAVAASLEAAVASAGPAGPLLFAGAYALAVAALVPAAPLTLLAGALFGPVVGTAVVSAGATAGATLAFLLARGAAAPALEKVFAGNAAWANARSALSAASASGAKLVLLLRLSPLIPFSLSNYALGALTDVGVGGFVLGTWAGALPGTAAYVAAGAAAATAAAGGDASSSSGTPAWLLALGAVATLGAVKLVGDAAGEALKGGGSSAGEATATEGDGAGKEK